MDQSINQALHEAIATENLDDFHEVLRQPNLNLNYKNEEGVTPLIASMRAETAGPVMVKCLIEAGCDVNLPEDELECSPMYAAVECNLISVLHLLIEKGADINAQLAEIKHSPLHAAVFMNSLETVCALLYYGADVNVVNAENMTPLMEACSDVSRGDIAEVLIKFYGDFSCTKAGIGYNALNIAISYGSLLAIDLVKAGADVNWIDYSGHSVLHQALYLTNAELFKFFWFRADHDVLLSACSPFLLQYVNSCRFSNTEWLECLKLILNAPIARSLIDHCKFYTERETFRIGSDAFNFLSYLLRALLDRNIKQNDRMCLIYSCLRFNAQIKLHDLQYAYLLYGFNDEFQALIYAGNLRSNFNSTEEVVRFFKGLVMNDARFPVCEKLEKPFYGLGAFSMTLEEKQELVVWARENLTNGKSEFLEKLNAIPETPTLRELSRNVAQMLIKEYFKITKLYRFHDAVKDLKLPEIVKDILIFKKPIY